MANIDCPGSETWRKGYGVQGHGLDPLDAIINAYLRILIFLAGEKTLGEFLEKKCGGDCWRKITGPKFDGITGEMNIEPNGTFRYDLYGMIEFEILCSPTAGEISNEHLLNDLIALLKNTTKKER